MSAEATKSDWVCPDGAEPPVGTVEVVAWTLLIVGVLAARAAFAPDMLFDWDSVNYSWALVDFDVYEHQPHAPGYPVFVALLWLARWLPGGEVVPFLAVNAVLGSGTLLLLGAMVRKPLGPAWAWMLAASFAVCPPFWFQGAVSAAYVAECFGSVLVAASAIFVARGALPLPAAALLVALAIGIRPNGVITLLPVALYGTWLARPGRKAVGQALAAFVAGCLVWFVPLMIGAGGLSRFREASSALVTWQIQAGSVLSGEWSYGVDNVRHLVLYFADAMNVLLLLLLVDWVVAAARGRVTRRSLGFLAAWLVPGALVYGLHHLPKSGYVLTLAPIGFLATAVVAHAAIDVVQGWKRRVMLAINLSIAGLYLALNTTAFFVAVPWELLYYEDAPLPLPKGIIVTGDYGRTGLAYRVWPQRRIREIVAGMDPETDLALFVFGTHEMHRLVSRYHPDHWLVASSVAHERAYSRIGQPPWNDTFGDFQQVILRSPVFDKTWMRRTWIGSDGERLLLRRGDQSMWLDLPHKPERIVVFLPCPPCELVATVGVTAGPLVPVGAGFIGRELTLGAAAEAIDGGSAP